MTSCSERPTNSPNNEPNATGPSRLPKVQLAMTLLNADRRTIKLGFLSCPPRSFRQALQGRNISRLRHC
ncbi:hypothetical protein BGZ61DRAFT_449486 [Ilyonectria robusta]|uniref:uncharacterized protein n=1 Tax=Ilyonectria robusta TaxID=1079257 RepID=UPI001E8E8951|nr:uncharacterized protein BGZ61DRAFT_449486 [Ilyonectria robusta]KAH8706151.1 hypothetical protein BGZ61DRAFT_449486 [Ilyonectria robusta]